MNIARQLMKMQDEAFDRQGLNHAPDSALLLQITRKLAEAIAAAPDLLTAITPADLEELTAHNYHTARQAAEKALKNNGMKHRKITIDLYITGGKTAMPDDVAGVSGGSGSGLDVYAMMINGAKSEERQAAAFLHECLHIWHKDHVTDNATKTEAERRQEAKILLRLLQIMSE